MKGRYSREWERDSESGMRSWSVGGGGGEIWKRKGYRDMKRRYLKDGI